MGLAPAYIFLIFHVFAMHMAIADFLDIEELKEMKYNIDIMGIPLNTAEIKLEEGMPMTSQSGQKYFCVLPEAMLTTQINAEDENKEKPIPASLPSLLGPIHGKEECLLKIKGWWTYELCPGRHVKQYHLEADESKGSILLLGVYFDDFDWTNKTNEAYELHKSQRYHSQNYVNGTTCDLTQKPRQVSVRYKCDENSLESYIEHVDEPFTCSYIITVRTPLICSHPYTRPPPNKKPHDIICHPLLLPQEYERYQRHVIEHPEVESETDTVETFDEGVGKVYVYYSEVDKETGDVKPTAVHMLEVPIAVKKKTKVKRDYDENKYRSAFHQKAVKLLEDSHKKLIQSALKIEENKKKAEELITSMFPKLSKTIERFQNKPHNHDLINRLRKINKQLEDSKEQMILHHDIAIKMIEIVDKNEDLYDMADDELLSLLNTIIMKLHQQDPTADMARMVHMYVQTSILSLGLMNNLQDTVTQKPTLALNVKLQQELKKIGSGDGDLTTQEDDEMFWWANEGAGVRDLVFSLLGGDNNRKKEESKQNQQTNNYNFDLNEKLKIKVNNNEEILANEE